MDYFSEERKWKTGRVNETDGSRAVPESVGVEEKERRGLSVVTSSRFNDKSSIILEPTCLLPGMLELPL